MVGGTGIEPVAFPVSGGRSPAELTARQAGGVPREAPAAAQAGCRPRGWRAILGDTVHADGLPTPQRYWSMLAIAVGIGVSVLDASVANVALPTIAR